MAMISAFTSKSVNETARDTGNAEVVTGTAPAQSLPRPRADSCALAANSSGQIWYQRCSLNAPRKMMHAAGGSQHGGAARCEGQAYESGTGNLERGLGVGRDLDDTAFAGNRSRHIEIALHIKRQALGTSQTSVKGRNPSVRIDLVHAIETGGCGSGHKQIPVRPERQMVRGDARLKCGKDEDLTVLANLENSATAIAHVKIFGVIERDAGRDAHALSVGGHGAVRSHPVDRAIKARGDVHLASTVEGDGSGIGHLRQERLDVVIGIDFVDGHGHLLPARSGESDVNVALGIESRIGHRMQIFGNRSRDFDLVRIARRSIRRHDNRSGRSAGRHSGDQKVVRADDHGTLNFSKTHCRATQLRGTQAAADDAHLASRQGGAGKHGLNVRVAIDILLTQQTVGNSHEPQLPDNTPVAINYRGSRPKCRRTCITFEPAYGRRLNDIEYSKKYKAQEQRLPRYRHRDQSDELPGNFVDHHKLRVFQATGPGDAGGGRNSSHNRQNP